MANRKVSRLRVALSGALISLAAVQLGGSLAFSQVEAVPRTTMPRIETVPLHDWNTRFNDWNQNYNNWKLQDNDWNLRYKNLRPEPLPSQAPDAVSTPTRLQ